MSLYSLFLVWFAFALGRAELDEDLVDVFVDNLLDRAAFERLPERRERATKLEETTLGKPGHLVADARPTFVRPPSTPPSAVAMRSRPHSRQTVARAAFVGSTRPAPRLDRFAFPTSHARARGPIAAATKAQEAPLNVDVAVIGGGPAGYAMAAQLQEREHTVALVDPTPERGWPNNYGSWRIEWDAIARRLGMPALMTDGVAREWPITDTFFGGSWDMDPGERLRLDRAYLQVNRTALKAMLSAKFGTGVTVLPTTLQAKAIEKNVFDGNLTHDATGSTLTLDNGRIVRAKLVVDATGFQSKIVMREADALAGLSKPLPPGYQIAYGFLCDIEGDNIGPYDNGAMTLFDYRTDHFEAAVANATDATSKAEAEAALHDAELRPSFTYVMPYGPSGDGYMQAFFEETSLVGRGERRLEFSTLKTRAMLRLKHLGLRVREGSIRDEEYCLIPMGGNLPDLSQRIIAAGSAAAMVHPSTGYAVGRTLTSVADVAVAISNALRSGSSPTQAAVAAYKTLWSRELRYERDFQVFGGEFLGQQPVENLRGFFSAFFQLDAREWGGFLAGWPGLPGNEYHDEWYKRLMFCVKIFAKLPPKVAGAMMMYVATFSFQYGNNFFRSVATPLFDSTGEETGELFNDTYVVDKSVQLAGNGPPADLDNPRPPGSLTDDRDWIRFQEEKRFEDQPLLADSLPALHSDSTVDVVVVGVGPAGLAMAAELAKRGLEVGLVGPDKPFTNNYGVWADEFEQLGLGHTLIDIYKDAVFVTDEKIGAQSMGRRYGRVGRKEFRDELLARCKDTSHRGVVRYHAGLVKRIVSESEGKDRVELVSGEIFHTKLVTMSTGHNRQIMHYEGTHSPLWQTAYGIEVSMENHPWDPDKAVFMDLSQSDIEKEGDARIPSFLYVLPGKDKVFLEETCLVSQVQMPFDELKRRLYRRLENLKITFPESAIIEEEASWIPLGGALPKTPQRVIGFGAAAGMVHPASGYSIVNSLQKASPLADIIAEDIRDPLLNPHRRTERAWTYLWSSENRRKLAFYEFGSDTISRLPSATLKEFMDAFYQLPTAWWQGFLANTLNWPLLIPLAMTMWIRGNYDLKEALLRSFFSPSGVQMFKTAMSPVLDEKFQESQLDSAPLRSQNPHQNPLHDLFRRDQLRKPALSGIRTINQLRQVNQSVLVPERGGRGT